MLLSIYSGEKNKLLLKGGKNGIQYTVPIENAVEQVRIGSEPVLTTKDKHLRECYVVPEK